MKKGTNMTKKNWENPATKAISLHNRVLRNKPAAVPLPVQLPLWAERVRGLPNSLARSALFTAGGKKEARRSFDEAEIVSVGGFAIRYSGAELRQDDQDVFLQIVHLGRMYEVGDNFVVSGNMILTGLGWGRSTEKYARLRDSIKRLTEGTLWVSFNAGKLGYTGRLIDKLKWVDSYGTALDPDDQVDARSVKWQFRLDPDIVGLFGKDTFSLVDWEQRLTLNALEKWLHSFYFTHREPMPYKTETILKLCGSLNRSMPSFRAKLRKALARLEEIRFLEEGSAIGADDLVRVRRRLEPPLL